MKMQKLALTAVSLAAAATSNAALVDRGNGMIYDDILDVTWASDVRAAWTLGYDPVANDFSLGANNGDDFLSYDQSIAFVGAVNTTSFDGGSTTGYLGVTSWRLPQLNYSGAELINSGFTSANAAGVQNRGRNITDTNQELSHLYNVSLGGLPSASAPADCQSSANGGCIWNTVFDPNANNPVAGLFENTAILDTNNFSGGSSTLDAYTSFFYEQLAMIEDPDNPGQYIPEPNRVYKLIGRQGYQNDTALTFGSLDGGGRVWLVADGDVAATVVPVPAAAWLFGSALVGLGIVRRRSN